MGDAVGDLGRDQEYRNRYGLVSRLFDDGKSTDDTEFGVLTARALLDAKGELTPEKTAEAEAPAATPVAREQGPDNRIALPGHP